ncbi:MAG TPA: hypothetical protein VFC84_18710 [Desulfosporosinus sp.]|nr:hypothetical protein [Desulfosporosinus sp.]
MEVGGILAPGGTVSSNLLKQWQVGERLFVKVVQKTAEGVGTIRVNGLDVSAILESSTQVGDTFWVKVGRLNEGSLSLIRQPIVEQQGQIPVTPQQFKQVTDRGLPLNTEIISLLKSFPTERQGLLGALLSNLQGTPFDGLITNLRKTSPKWESLSQENGAEVLLECLRKLGLDYEQRIQQLMKLDPQAKETEKSRLRETFKFALLQALQNQETLDYHASEDTVKQLLQTLTGQQLWFKTGALDNAYLLLHLPLLNQEELVPVQIAIEAARKGDKIDEQHCRVGIQVETQQLGQVGIDAYFYGESLTFRVLTCDPQSLPHLLEGVLTEATTQFAKLGINLTQIETGDLNQNLEFQNFLQGSRRSGVDIER